MILNGYAQPFLFNTSVWYCQSYQLDDQDETRSLYAQCMEYMPMSVW